MSKISNPKKSFDQPRHLKSGVLPPPPHLRGGYRYMQMAEQFVV